MKKFAIIFTTAIFILCACGQKSYNINGEYLTETAYGMEDFFSEIEIEGNHMELEIEHFGETVEENEGTFTMDGNKITLNGINGKLEFIYDELEKTLYNEEMDTTWIIKNLFISSKVPDTNKEPQNDKTPAVTEPDPIPDNIQGTYIFSNDIMTAKLIISTNEYKLIASSPSKEPLEVSGSAVYAGTQLLFLEDGTSVSCPLDEQKGTIEYSGYTFTKQ